MSMILEPTFYHAPKFFASFPLPSGEGGAAAPGEGSPPHDLQLDEIVERAALIRRAAPPSPRGTFA
jgi:hypothetical protein